VSAIATPALAASVALSVNEINNFLMSSSTGGFTFSGFTFSNDTAATEDGGTGGADMMDAPAACIGGDCASWENEFFSHTPSTAEFSYGDAQIKNTDVLGGNGEASAIGEVVVNDGIAHASGSNVLTSVFLDVQVSTIIDFYFNADALLQTSISGAGISSAANMAFNISLTDPLNVAVFSWSPDGAAGGIFGGTEISDAFDMNYGITGTTTYDPGSGVFRAMTDSLAAGQYTLNIKMENQANAASVVPVPPALWLFGSGLLGLAGISRRRRRG
jgi:hypothetical protein